AGGRAAQLVVVAQVRVADPLRGVGAAVAAERPRPVFDDGGGGASGERFAAVEAGVVGPGVHLPSSAGPRWVACRPRASRPRRRQVPASSARVTFQSCPGSGACPTYQPSLSGCSVSTWSASSL